MIIGLAVYSGFIIPFDLAFSPYFLQKVIFEILDYVIDCLFLADLILGFFTTYLNNKGREEYDSKLISKHHTKKIGFYIDFLSI
jgi:hypothetical protein